MIPKSCHTGGELTTSLVYAEVAAELRRYLNSAIASWSMSVKVIFSPAIPQINP